MSAEVVASLGDDDRAVDDLIESSLEVLMGDMTAGCIDEAVWVVGDEACEQAAVEAAMRLAEAVENERIRQVTSYQPTLTILHISTQYNSPPCTIPPSLYK